MTSPCTQCMHMTAVMFDSLPPHLSLVYAGTEKGVTLGTPIGMFVKNKDMRPHDYGDMSQVSLALFFSRPRVLSLSLAPTRSPHLLTRLNCTYRASIVHILQIPRPSHADFTYQMKYGFRASSGDRI
jgi:chorismate synthase